MNIMQRWLDRFTDRFNHLMKTTTNPHTGRLFTASDLDARTAELGHRVSHPHITRLLNGTANNPNLKTIVVIALVFNVSPNFFFEQDEDIALQLRDNQTNESDLLDFAQDLREAIRRIEKQHGI